MKKALARLLLVCSLALVPQLALGQDSQARFHKNEGAIPNSYIVVFNASVPAGRVAAFARQLAREHGGKVGYTYQTALRGFSVEMSEAQAIALSRSPQVFAFDYELGGTGLAATAIGKFTRSTWTARTSGV